MSFLKFAWSCLAMFSHACMTLIRWGGCWGGTLQATHLWGWLSLFVFKVSRQLKLCDHMTLIATIESPQENA